MASTGRNAYKTGPRGTYVVGPAAIWYVGSDGETVRADEGEVVALDAAQARHFRSGLRPHIPEAEEDEELLDETLPRATMLAPQAEA